MIFEIITLILGLLGLWLCSDIVIRKSIYLAKKTKISKFIIGLTILAIGTSLPELIMGINSAYYKLQGLKTSGIAIGNILGANIANLSLILALAFIISATSFRKKVQIKRVQEFALFGGILLFLLVSIGGLISRIDAIILCSAYGGYLTYMIIKERKYVSRIVNHNSKNHNNSILKQLIYLCIGLTVLVFSANIAVRSGVKIASDLGVKTLTVGILMALGTCLPELSVSLRALQKKQKDIAIANLIGSNIINLLIILGLPALISEFKVETSALWLEIPVLLGITIYSLFRIKKGLKMRDAIFLITIYILYLFIRFLIH